MTEQQRSAQNPRELTANELGQVAGGASDILHYSGTVVGGTFTPRKPSTGSTTANDGTGNGGVEMPNPISGKANGTTNFTTHYTLDKN
jgi:hypothetical protein